MDLRQIAYMVAVVDHGGFTRAASALHVAQPSLSQAVRRLETDLGVPLFLRTGRSFRLTEAGEAFVGPARRLLRDAASLRRQVDPHAALEAGTLDLVALPTAASDPLAALIGRFRTEHPGVVVRVSELSGADDVARMVLDGRCEVGLGEAGRARRDGLVERPLGGQDLVAVLPPGSTPRERMTVRALAAEPLVAGPPGTSVRDLIDRALAVHGLTADVRVETAQRDAVLPLVLAGAGIGVLPEPAARAAAAAGALVVPITPRLRRPLALVHRDRDLSPAARAFLRVVDAATKPPAVSR